jgi:low affinity Fe/Cu permease
MASALEGRAHHVQPRPEVPPIKRDLFTRCAAWATRATGGRWGFLSALAVVLVWAASGPVFHYSETWQLVINTGTTIVTFLMVFLIQNAQNRESKAIHLKLDELILCVRAARNEMIDIEHLTEAQLDQLAERYSKIAQRHQHKLEECFQTADEMHRACEQARETAVHAATPD